uniref:Glycosyl transferase n=1 Tax=Desulfovibrio sp. U5L TaxID=596152 RepID=I2PYB9_9BACT
MGYFVFVAMAAQLVMLSALFLLGRRHVLGGDGPEPMPDACPPVALIVPVTGDHPGMREAVASLLDQDYPDLTVVFVTADAADPAGALVAGVAGDDPRALLAVAGRAELCGQKNHNILAGIRAASTAEIFVFSDSSHLADRHFVTNLVAPIIRGDAPMTSGFHRIVPEDGAVGTIGMANTCLALHLMQPLAAITQPWGGAMAISRAAFERFGLARVWSRNIVDDFSMGPHLRRSGVAAWPVAAACLDTPLRAVSLARWDLWLTRQLLYLKFCIPLDWLVSILAVFILSAPPVLAAATVLGGIAGLVPGGAAIGALAYFAAFLGLGLAFRTLSPRPVDLLPWLRGYAATFLMLGWCFGRTFATNTMSWRGIDYKVGWNGVVRRIIR